MGGGTPPPKHLIKPGPKMRKKKLKKKASSGHGFGGRLPPTKHPNKIRAKNWQKKDKKKYSTDNGLYKTSRTHTKASVY